MSLHKLFRFSPGWVKTYYYFVYFEIAFFGAQNILNFVGKCSGGTGALAGAGTPLSCNGFGSLRLLIYTLGLFWIFIVPFKAILGIKILIRQKRFGSVITGFIFSSFSPATLGFYSIFHAALPYAYLFLSKWAILTWAALTAAFVWFSKKERVALPSPPSPPPQSSSLPQARGRTNS